MRLTLISNDAKVRFYCIEVIFEVSHVFAHPSNQAAIFSNFGSVVFSGDNVCCSVQSERDSAGS